MVSEREWIDYIQQDDPGRALLRKRQPSLVSIFRVPKFLKDTKKEAYVTQKVSFGPYHHRSTELLPMGHHKGRALRRMMKRFNAKNLPPGDPANNLYFGYFVFSRNARAEVLGLEQKIRDSYEDDIDDDGETLSRMLCLDGCFLLEVLRTMYGDLPSIDDAENCYDPIFGNNKLSHAASEIVTDILTLENQIPLIVLEKLLALELKSAVEARVRLESLMERVSGVLIPFDNIKFDTEQLSGRHHLLDFLHTVITSRQGDRVDQRKCIISIGCCCRQFISMLQCKRKARNDAKGIPRAVELRNAGIKFSPNQGGIKQIKFDEKSATILLPPIRVTHYTERVFRNLIAYEMCKPSAINYVSHYAALMNDLIDTEQDVAWMRRMGVIQNDLGSDKEVADLFNGLAKEVTVCTSSTN